MDEDHSQTGGTKERRKQELNEWGRERTAAGLGTVGRRWAGGGGRGEGGGGLVSLL